MFRLGMCPGLLANDQTISVPITDNRNARSVISHLNPIEHLHALALSQAPRPKAGFRVGYWAWETSQLPSEWKRGAVVVDEVWCPSVFTAHAVEDLLGQSRPIRVIQYPIPQAEFVSPDKARFGLHEEKVTFFSACDLRSGPERKNPLGAIEAFRRSGCGERGEAELLIKVHGDYPGSGLHAIQTAASKVPHVKILNSTLTIEDMRILRNSIDVVLSPHRSEGFGLVMAQAMRLAKPVIATGWSGNLDFMDSQSAALIDAVEVPAAAQNGHYQTGNWAEPDLDHAAALIKHLATDEHERNRLGKAGLDKINVYANPAAWESKISRYLHL